MNLPTTIRTSTEPTPATQQRAGHRLSAPRPSLLRLTAVELRKLIDTRSGVALIIVGAALIGIFAGGMVLFRDRPTLGQIVLFAGTPATMLIPVLATLLMTAERSQRTALTTDALVPQRNRTLTAKIIAVIGSAIVVAALTLLAGVVVAAVGPLLTAGTVDPTMDWIGYGWFSVAIVVAALVGAVLGMALGNAPAAIVIVLVWQALIFPMQSTPVVGPVLSWLDFSAVSTFVDGISGREIARAGVGIVVWVLVPGVIGWVRQLRTEVR